MLWRQNTWKFLHCLYFTADCYPLDYLLDFFFLDHLQTLTDAKYWPVCGFCHCQLGDTKTMCFLKRSVPTSVVFYLVQSLERQLLSLLQLKVMVQDIPVSLPSLKEKSNKKPNQPVQLSQLDHLKQRWIAYSNHGQSFQMQHFTNAILN